MKNSRQHAQRLKKLYRALKRAHSKVEPVAYDDPIDALILGILCERHSVSAAETAMKRIQRTFVNWNDLRVSRPEEITEAIGENTAEARHMAAVLTTALRAVFDGHHTLSLEPLKRLGKRPARQAIEKLGGVSRFVVDYCMLTSLQAHAIPLTEGMRGYLRRQKIVDSQADEEDIGGFLTRQVPAKSAYEFYALLRRECERPKIAGEGGKKTRRTKTRKATKTRVKK